MKIFSPTIINNFTASVGIVQGISGSQFSGSFFGNGTGITGIVTSSFAISASWAPGGSGNSLGTGFTNGGDTGSIPNDTEVQIGRADFRTVANDDGFRAGLMWNKSIIYQSYPIRTSPLSGSFVWYAGTFGDNGSIGFITANGEERYFEIGSADIPGGDTALAFYYTIRLSNSGINILSSTGSYYNKITINHLSPQVLVAISHPDAAGIVYESDYSSGIKSNDRSIPDVGTIRAYLTASYALTSSYQVNPRFITISSSAYTLGMVDLKNTLAFASGSGIQILTIPSSSVLMASVNDYIDLYQSGSARIQIASGSNSVILNSANGYMTRTTHSIASLLNVGRDRWVFFGDISIT